MLVRDGRGDDGFAEIRRAVASDPGYAPASVTLAYTFFDGDLARVRAVVGDSDAANSSLALALARSKRYDESIQVWGAVSPAAHDESIATTGKALRDELLSAKKYTLAQMVSRSLDPANGYASGQIWDGGFELGVKLENAPPFEWQISPGTQPQVLQSTQQPHGGRRSLVLAFNSTDPNGLRQLSQIIGIEPNKKYLFEGFYHSDVKTASPLLWQVADADGGAIIAEVPVADPSSDWKRFSVRFDAPAHSDGIAVRLVRAACSSTICPINGNLWLDDLSLTAQ
jgi:hypothetical protein